MNKSKILKLSSIFIIILLTTNCTSQISKEEALTHLDNVIGVSSPVKLQIEEINRDLLNHIKIVFAGEAISNEEQQKLQEFHELFNSKYSTTLNEIEQIPEFRVDSMLYNAMIDYINSVGSYERLTVPKVLEVCKDGIITEQEKLQVDFRDEVMKLIQDGKEFSELQHRYYSKYKLSDDEINKVFEKYGL